ncbi:MULTISPECIES: DedA family protein [Spirosoma]|uniref:DedA family protein n=1 Tax=Spirosoma sordidisoli TaxID=2502893 RepID=A0A4Q2USJ3_9BACT|nr:MULTISPECIES: DedA family protein [Spirosoma]RYC69799.1 DedA family protein [Spirosoma sordidisoli]
MEANVMSILGLNTAWIEWGGTTLIAALVFIETGFLLGLIVPGGETLLFTAGLLTGVGTLHLPVLGLVGVLVVAAVAGDLTGFWIGRQLGDRLRHQPDTFLFKRADLEESDQFYRKHPKRALLIGRFFPIIRTFNPLLAANSGMPWTRFLLLTSTGCIAYITTLVLAGYWLGGRFPGIGQYVEYIFLGVVVLVLGTLLVKRFRRSDNVPQ